MYLVRAFLIWLIIIFVETIHGTLRQIFPVPLVGDFSARRLALFTGTLLILTTACVFIRWIAAPDKKSLLIVGLMWSVLTLAFEFGLGVLLGYSRDRMFKDYDWRSGGLMSFGILFVFFAPILAEKSRRRTKN